MKKASQTITYTRNSNGFKKTETVDLFVGVGATLGVGSDCYPYTVWDWRVTKGGKLIVFITGDSHKLNDGKIEYTSNEPSETNPAQEINLSQRNCRFWVGNRRFYQDPSY